MADIPETAYWVAWSQVPGVGAVKVQRLLRAFGSLDAAWRASRAGLMAMGMSDRLVEAVDDKRRAFDVEREWDRLQRKNVQVITLADTERYPRLLRESAGAPALLYVKGKLDIDGVRLAVVGTRRATAYGRQVTESLTRELASAGVVIVSGLARGVDSFAHRATIAAGGVTIAVLGSALDVMYPEEHRDLARDIVEHGGAVISEYPLGRGPEPSNFPARNRIVSGLCLGVLVTEAPAKSGALVTAQLAAEQGRDVYAVPGAIYSQMSIGCLKLIQDGAIMVIEAADILSQLNVEVTYQRIEMRKALPEDPTERSLLGLLGDAPLHIDEICRQSELPIATISSTLVMMELKGMVRQIGGMQYIAG